MERNINSYKSAFFKTSDGATLHYIEKGEGRPLVMVPEWSQTAEIFKYQIEELSSMFRCIAIDMRGHGDSENVEYGLTIKRLAIDLHEFLLDLGLNDICLLGHSMGCSVIWSLIEMFGEGLISRFIFIDEPPCLLSDPAWDKQTMETAGALFTDKTLLDTCSKLNGPDGEMFTAGMIKSMFNKKLPPAEMEWIIQCSLKMPRNLASRLLRDHVEKDWRNLFSRITVPTLIVGAEGSQVPWKSQRWIHKQINNSELILFSESDCVKHFIFYESPEKFNMGVKSFLG